MAREETIKVHVELKGKYAREIVVVQDLRSRTHTLTIDGEPFPWHILSGIRTNISDLEGPAITITIPAERLRITDTINAEEEDVD